MGSSSGFLQIKGLKKSYDGIDALRGIDLTLQRGEFLSLFGPNGAGKTTLIRIIATLLKPGSGSVSVMDFDIEEHPEDFRAQLGVISHQSFLYDDLSARENLEFYAALYRVDDPEAKSRELLKLVGLHDRGDSKVSGFSRGMQQRLSIARALINDPSLLLLDEPYTGLDERASILLSGHLRQLHSRQRTIVMVTHDLKRGLESATKVGILSKGRLVYFKDRSEVDIDEFEHIYLRYLQGAQDV
ncbi:fluoroquinolones export ATP-binding protein/MT2762 [bacterium BMS3Bbin07]|nr:fluoroquinolones export ATP-binding protein/MT2762 [bacterium BMS3Bbin07]HDH02524.1 heme ABC exporter ATP-binding protein CcmA [Nitrospirota bacterium]